MRTLTLWGDPSKGGVSMKLGVYSRPDGSGPLVLAALCMRPTIEAEHLYGPLQFQGVVETDQAVEGIDWVLVIAEILDASYATIERDVAGHRVISVMDADAQPTDTP